MLDNCRPFGVDVERTEDEEVGSTKGLEPGSRFDLERYGGVG